MDYHPKPIDTTNIELPEEVLKLKNILAKNTHEQWAKNRIEEGWVYGSERNDLIKTHPCLKPYEKLTKSEKYYDEITAMETLKVICKLGYKIEKNDFI